MDYQENEMKVQRDIQQSPLFLFLYLTDIKFLSSSKSYWMLSDSECDSG